MRAPLVAFTALLAAGLTVRAGAAPVTYSLSYLPAGEVASLAQGYENLMINDTAAHLSDAGAAARRPQPWPWRADHAAALLCSDVFDYYVSGGVYTLGKLSDTLHDAVKLGQIEALIENGLPGATDDATSAALQVAVWEIENEPGHAGYSVGSGNFYVSGDGGTLDPQMVSDANADLQNVESGVWTSDPHETVMQFEPVGGDAGLNQSFIYLAPAAVPEPAGMALLAVGSLALLTTRRRRSRPI